MRHRAIAGLVALAALALPAAAHAGDTDVAGTAIACSTAEVAPGGSYTCAVTYTNLGPNAIVPADNHRIVIFDSGFSDVTGVSSPQGSCSLTGASPHCPFASIAPGATVQMTAAFKAGEQAAGFDDDAIFDSIEATDPNHANDRLTATVRIREQVAPDTSLSKDFKKLEPPKLKRAKWSLKSTVPGSTFDCRVDKGKFAPCSSPAKAKKLNQFKQPGKHRFCARATAPNGLVDATPACDKFKVESAGKPKRASRAMPLAKAPPRETQGWLYGETAEHNVMSIGIGYFAEATKFRMTPLYMRCDEKDRRIPAFKWLEFDTSDPFEFRDASQLREKHALTYVNNSRLRGRGHYDEATGTQVWKGSYKAAVVVLKDGEHVDTCQIETRWRTSPGQLLMKETPR